MAKKISTRSKASVRLAKRPSPTGKTLGSIADAGAVENRKTLFPIVGVGASAGGLEAFTAFLRHLPPESGMAFVLIQHLDPKHQSQLTDLLRKATRMPVLEVNARSTLKANHVYVIAPAVCLKIMDGVLEVEPRESSRNLPIDYFLRSLALDRSSAGIGVVLSGTASDGTLGLKSIKAEGGVTFAQEPSSAKFDGMPRSAIAAGVVDFVLPPAEIAKRVVQLAKHPYVVLKSDQSDDSALETESELNQVFHLLRIATGNDFNYYKPATVRRRLRRRMVLHGSETLGNYLAYLQEHPSELRALADDLLISVTSFFREPKTFETLVSKVFPQVIKNRSAEQPIRIWVPGCSTGEEAYSVAICLTEFLEHSESNVPIQIFATDVSEAVLERARSGTYGMPAITEVSPARLKRYFTKTNGVYQIQKTIREMCVFAKQNITRDPPFHNLDLITCCNVLIYFDSVLQRKALSIFHYALKTDGFLMLGSSEGVGALPNAFSPLDKKLKLYSKRASAHPLHIQFPATDLGTTKADGSETFSEHSSLALDVQKAADRMLLAQYAPAGVIVDDALNVLHVRGNTGAYLQLAPGEPTYNLLRMAREGMIVGLRSAFAKTKQKKTTVTQTVHINQNGQIKDVNLKIIPINSPARSGPIHFMVLFEDVPASTEGSPRRREQKAARPAKTAGSGSVRENANLRQELTATREYLQSIIEEQEAASEELKSASEEARATNEELETAKEELQSSNEELNTLNEELKTRNAALTELNYDVSNVLTGIDVPLVMVGKDLKVRRFTQPIEPMLNLIDSDIGRSISDLKPNIDVPDLIEMLRSVVNGGKPVAREILSPEGRWYSLQALPYRKENEIAGALLVLHDIDVARRAQDYADAIVETTRQPLLILSGDLKVRRANRAFHETFKVSRDETENRYIYDLGDSRWNIPKLREALERILLQNQAFDDFEVEHNFDSIGHKILLLSGREIRESGPFGRTILLTIEDITARVEQHRLDLLKKDRALASEQRLRRLEAELARVVRALTVGELAVSIAHEVNQPLAAVVTSAEAGLRWLDGKTPNIGEAQQSLALIARDGNRASGVIRRIREFVTKDVHEAAVFDINETAKEAIDFANAELQGSNIIIRVDLTRELPPVRGNRIQLQQVVLNLIMNGRDAITAAHSESRELVVKTQVSAEGRVVVAVRDSGIGIKPQDAERMFDAFFTTKSTGIGLGLSISRSIIEAHGGRIWAEQNRGGPGLTVQFELPAETAINGEQGR